MHELISLELFNVLYFKKVKIPLSIPGLTFVRGCNMDADQATPTGNGAGKSLLFSTIANVRYQSPPLAIKKKAKKELLTQKDSAIRLTFRSTDDSIYSVTQTPGKYTILKDDEDLKLTRIPMAEKFIESIFPLSEVEFYTTAYVSTQKPYPFQNDSDVQRLEHLISVFGLDNYEKLKQWFMARLREVKDLEVRMSVLQQRRTNLKEKVEAARKAFDPDRLKTIRAEYHDLDVKAKKLSKSEHDLSVTLRDLRTLLTIEEELDVLRKKYRYKEPPKAAIINLKQEQKVLTAWTKYKALLQAYNKSKSSLEARLAEIERPEKNKRQLTKEREALESDIEEQTEKKKKLKSIQSEHEDLESECEESRDKLKALGWDGKTKLKLDGTDYSEMISQCKTTLKLKQVIHDCDGGKCPTCLSELDLDNIKRAVKKAEEQLPTYQTKQKMQALTDVYLGNVKALKTHEHDPEALEKVEQSMKDAKKLLSSIEHDLKQLSDYTSIESSIAELEQPVRPKAKPEMGMSDEELETDIELCNEILRHLSARSKLLSNNTELPTTVNAEGVRADIKSNQDALDSVEKQASKLRVVMSEMSTNIETLTNARSELELYRTEQAEVVKEISDIKPQLKTKQVLDVLTKAYGSKGLRTLAAANICSLLETNLNHYRGLIFAEPFTFSITADEAGMSIMVDRGHGMISDVRNLSGAESNCFRLLFVLSMLPLIPDSRRVNVLCLDEPMSHADIVTREIFLERFLPVIKEVVPSVFIITPNLDETAKESSEWMIKKHRGVSKVIMGKA